MVWWLLLGIVVILIIILIFSKSSNYVSPIPGKTIWLLWLQGWDKAPWVVQKVCESWKTLNPGWNVELVDEKNLKKYVDIPYINNINTPAAKSDAIRLSLLEKHGGVWADASMLCMVPLDEWVYDALEPAGFWMYHGREECMGPASWFIVSTNKSSIIKKWKEYCDKYWSNGRRTADEYAWMDTLFAKLLSENVQCRMDWSVVPNICCESPGQAHMLAGKTESNNQELKDILSTHPPYAVKLTAHVKYEDMPESNAYFAIQKALEPRTEYKKHEMKYNDMTIMPSKITVVPDCGQGGGVEQIKGIVDSEVFVYDKCDFCKTMPEGVRCAPRKNSGRDMETYLHFVIKNYNNLPNEITFVPSSVEKHDRLTRLKTITNGGKDPRSFTLESQEDFTIDEYDGQKQKPANIRPFRKWYETYVGDWEPSKEFFWNGVLKTGRDRILEKPIHFYKNIIDQFDPNTDAHEVVHYIERAITSIF